MHGRLSTYQGDADQLNPGFQAQTDAVQQIDGFSKAFFGVDKSSGKAFSLTLWESEEALEASAAKADELRSSATQPSGASIESVQHFEITIALGD
jgi:heme-degrading monooxygenase HmoA